MCNVRWFGLLIAAVLMSGCMSSRIESPAEVAIHRQDPPSIGVQVTPEALGNRCLWGFWNVRIEEDHRSSEVVPLRAAAMHLNVVRKLEVEPCHTCLLVENIVPDPPNGLEADLRLTHPFPGHDKLTGFDVRGIFISGSSPTYHFPVSNRDLSWDESDPRLLNYDGFTTLFNPTEFPETLPGPPALRYIPGINSPGGDLTATLNPFIAYRRDAPRRMFEAGGCEIRTVSLYVPDGPLEFGYAVDVSWQLVNQVVDPVVDFPPDANCLEAYKIDIQTVPQLKSQGTSAVIDVEVFDHQGFDTISCVTVEQPELFTGEAALSYSVATGDDSYLFSGTITNELGVGLGEYPLLARVVDTEPDQNLGVVDAWQLCNAEVKPETGGWVRTWGWDQADLGYGVHTDDLGNVYAVGDFSESVDFDPGPGIEYRASEGVTDVYLSKFSPDGEFQWVRTWGGTGEDCTRGVVVSGTGEIYVVGFFNGVVDFDPGPSEDLKVAVASRDAYVCKFNSGGAYEWARTWGGDTWDRAMCVALDGLGAVYVGGDFKAAVDFDPGPDEVWLSSMGDRDIFLTKFDLAGTHEWVRGWGGELEDRAFGVGVDDSGYVYITGYFCGSVDFDPGVGEELRNSQGCADTFLSRFEPTSEFQWVRAWGGSGWDVGRGLAVGAPGNAYVTGHFDGSVDFDPGPGIEMHVSNGSYDAFLAKFGSDGEFAWAGTWGAQGWDRGFSVALDDGDGSVCVGGFFKETVDFDPGPGSDERTSIGAYDVSLSKFTPLGDLLWSRTWGGTGGDRCHGVAVGGLGDIYVTGYFDVTVDFDPGPGIEECTSNGVNDVFLSKILSDGNW